MIHQLITTDDLIGLQDDLMNAAFDAEWQKASDGVITDISGASPTETSLPCNFSSESLSLDHWFDNEVLDVSKDRITLSDDKKRKRPLPVLNIPNRGFFRIKSVTNNQSCVIESVTPAFSLALNRWLNQEDNYTGLETGTELNWSLGAFEGKIAKAYETLIQDLHVNKVAPEIINDFDATYKQAIEFKALELIYDSLIRSTEDVYVMKARNNYKKYKNELGSVKPKSSNTTAAHKLERSS